MGLFKNKKKGKLQYNTSAAVTELNQYVKEFVRIGGIKWLDATVIAIIPTWSGASRATFEKLANDLGTSIPYGPQRSKKDRRPLGRSESAGSGFFTDAQGRHYFIYRTQLRYLIYNEFNRATKGPPPQPFSDNVRFTPYHFQDKGDKAWLAYAKKFKPPKTWKHLK
jgi:hypothetical protein